MKFIANALVVAATLSAISAHAEGLYLGGSVGGSHYKGDAVGGAPTDRSDTGGKVYGGYSFTPNFSLEAGYADLGKFKSDAGHARADGLYLDAVGTLPLGNNVSALGRIGAFNGRLTDPLVDSDRGTNIKVGAGLQYDIDKNLGVRGEWERYRFDQPVSGKANADLYSIGLNYRF